MSDLSASAPLLLTKDLQPLPQRLASPMATIAMLALAFVLAPHMAVSSSIIFVAIALSSLAATCDQGVG